MHPKGTPSSTPPCPAQRRLSHRCSGAPGRAGERVCERVGRCWLGGFTRLCQLRQLPACIGAGTRALGCWQRSRPARGPATPTRCWVLAMARVPAVTAKLRFSLPFRKASSELSHSSNDLRCGSCLPLKVQANGSAATAPSDGSCGTGGVQSVAKREGRSVPHTESTSALCYSTQALTPWRTAPKCSRGAQAPPPPGPRGGATHRAHPALDECNLHESVQVEQRDAFLQQGVAYACMQGGLGSLRSIMCMCAKPLQRSAQHSTVWPAGAVSRCTCHAMAGLGWASGRGRGSSGPRQTGALPTCTTSLRQAPDFSSCTRSSTQGLWYWPIWWGGRGTSGGGSAGGRRLPRARNGVSGARGCGAPETPSTAVLPERTFRAAWCASRRLWNSSRGRWHN